MKTIYLVRHGKASLQGKEEERVLLEEGVAQAHQLKSVFESLSPKISKLYSSPYVRAIQSFQPFSQSSGLSISVVNEFHELKLPTKPSDDKNEVRKNLWADHNFKTEGGESRHEAARRALQALNKIKDQLEEGTAAAVMTHGTLIGAVVKEFGLEPYGYEEWRSMGMPDVFRVDFEGDKTQVSNVGCAGVDSFRIGEQANKNLEINKDYLKEKQYKKSNYLEARIAIHNFGSEQESLHGWVFRHLQITKPVKVLDVGCGTGIFWQENVAKLPAGSIVVLTDFSQGMVDKARQNVKGNNVSFEVADIENLKYADESFDIVMAHHVVYHAENKDKALKELRRVVKKDGFVTVTSNSERHMFNVYEIGKSLDHNFPTDRIIDSFTEEVADGMLLRYFSQVQKLVSEDLLKVTDMQILLDYVRTGVEPRNIAVASDFYEKYSVIAKKEMDAKGYFGIPKRSPLYICRKN